MMTIAIPYENGAVFPHFGHTEQFMLYQIDHGVIVSRTPLETGEVHCGALAALLADNSVDALLCGQLGSGAKAAVERAGLMLFSGVSGQADDAAQAFADGTLEFSPDALCLNHSGHCGQTEDAPC